MSNSQRFGALTADQTTLEAVPVEGRAGWLVRVGSLIDGQPDMEAGRIVVDPERRKAAFQPAPFSAYAAGPDVLRALAELVEHVEKAVAA